MAIETLEHVVAAAEAAVKGEMMAITLLGDVRFLLEIAPRLGAAIDEPEGVRYVQLSDTLVTEMVKLLVQYELGLRKPEPNELTVLTKEDIRRLDLVKEPFSVERGDHAEDTGLEFIEVPE